MSADGSSGVPAGLPPGYPQAGGMPPGFPPGGPSAGRPQGRMSGMSVGMPELDAKLAEMASSLPMPAAVDPLQGLPPAPPSVAQQMGQLLNMPGLLVPPPLPASPQEVLSPEPRANAILHKYAAENIVESADLSHLTIYLCWEGITRPLRVLNPSVFRRKVAVIYKYEVMMALGLMGGLQERFLNVTHLVPTSDMTSPILAFEASTLHGSDIIMCQSLRHGESYNVEVEDRREEALAALTDEQMEEIHAAYERYDTDGDGGISIDEYSAEVSRKSQDRKQALFRQYDAYVAENPQNRAAAEATLQDNLQKLDESEETLTSMFIKSDVDGNGVLSFKEFALAEAAWMSSGMNPSRVQMF